jgi:hypothetical protein
MTNSVFANSNNLFKAACIGAGLPNTVRQASKWRNNKGLAFTVSLSGNIKFMLALVAIENQKIINSVVF